MKRWNRDHAGQQSGTGMKTLKPAAYYYKVFFDTSDPLAIVSVEEDVKGFNVYRFYDANLIEDWPEGITFTVEGEHPEDYLVGGLHWMVFSDRAKKVFERCEVKDAQFLPVRVVWRNGQEVGKYWALNVVRGVDGLDWDHTRWERGKNPRESETPWFDVLVPALRLEAVKGLDIFRLDIKGDVGVEVFISKRVKECLEKAGVATGFEFNPIRAYGEGEGMEVVGEAPELPAPVQAERPKPRFTDEQYKKDYELKKRGLEKVLGQMHPLVVHWIIGFRMGGPVDLYVFPDVDRGTAFATMELIEPDGSGPRPSDIGTYELVAFSRHRMGDAASEAAFKEMERRINSNFTSVARNASEAVFNPGDTAEIPAEQGQPTRYLVFDEFRKLGADFRIGRRKHGLLLVIEVFQGEMEYARRQGTEALLDKLKAKGHYPFSDLDREPVV